MYDILDIWYPSYPAPQISDRRITCNAGWWASLSRKSMSSWSKQNSITQGCPFNSYQCALKMSNKEQGAQNDSGWPEVFPWEALWSSSHSFLSSPCSEGSAQESTCQAFCRSSFHNWQIFQMHGMRGGSWFSKSFHFLPVYLTDLT